MAMAELTGEARLLVEGIALEARHAANLLCDALGQRDTAERPIPAVFALAAAAHLRQLEWRQHGLDQFVHPSPMLSDLTLEDLLDRPPSRMSPDCARRLRQLAVSTLLAWTRNFSWSARRHLGCDVVINCPNGELSTQTVEPLASFLWNCSAIRRIDEGDDGACS